MSLPILQTKFFIPRSRASLVQRDALLARLLAEDTLPITLISAPAGFGKTTLVCEWIQTIRKGLVDKPSSVTPTIAWLSLDEQDNDPIRFFTYLIAALQRQQPTLGAVALELLAAPQAPPFPTILTLLLNDVSELTTPLALVLDDFHLVSAPAIHEALTFLLDHLPPTLRLIITSRSDPPLPLARWRVRGQLREIRAHDLRFNTTEAAAFLQQMLALPLTQAEVAALTTRTEGWIAALQLAALSMQGRSDLPKFILAFSGSNRYIVDYLAEEVWQRLPATTQNFLMQTALLERFCADLCAAVTGQANAQRLLADLDHANLFLVALDDERNWYRYHHLFRDLLTQRLRAQADVATINELHQRAADWHRAQGSTDEAIRHYLAADAVDQAVELIEVSGYAVIGQGNIMHLGSWLDKLPIDLVRTRPRLALWRAWVLNLTGQTAALEQWLQETEFDLNNLPAPLAQDLQAQIATLHAYQARRQSDLAATIRQLQQALAACVAENLLARVTINLNLGFTYSMMGEFAQAEQALQATQDEAQRIGAMHMLILAKGTQANVAVAQGKLRRARQLCDETIHAGLLHNGGQPFPSAGYAYAVLGNLLYEQNAWVEAEQALRQGLELGEMMADGTMIRRAIFRLAPLQQMLGDEEAAQLLWQRAKTASDTVEEPQVMLQQVRAWLVRATLAADQDALTQASQWATTASQYQTKLPSYSAAYAQMLCAWIDLLRGQPAQVIRRLTPLVESAAAAGHTQHWLEMMALQALAHAAVRDSATAHAQLHQLLTLAASEGYIRLLVDLGEPMRLLLYDFYLTMTDAGLASYLDQVLAVFGGSGAPAANAPATMIQLDRPRPQESQNLIEPLTDREREILRLVADGLSNSEIAAKLIVTVGTVKKHLNNIYGKLGVATRTQAIARARAVRLIE